jgi:hypothetical protein
MKTAIVPSSAWPALCRSSKAYVLFTAEGVDGRHKARRAGLRAAYQSAFTAPIRIARP